MDWWNWAMDQWGVHVPFSNSSWQNKRIRTSDTGINSSNSRSRTKVWVSTVFILAFVFHLLLLQHNRRYGDSSLGTLWNNIFCLFLLSSVCHANPEYFFRSYGCGKVSSSAGSYQKILNVAENSLPGKIKRHGQSLFFECPEFYGILVRRPIVHYHGKQMLM